MCAGPLEVVGGGRLIAGLLEMACNLAGQGAGLLTPTGRAGKRLGDPPVEKPAPRQARFFVDEGAQLLVAEVILEI